MDLEKQWSHATFFEIFIPLSYC